MISFLSDKEIYGKVICDIVPRTRNRLWIATADIKDMYPGFPPTHNEVCHCGGMTSNAA